MVINMNIVTRIKFSSKLNISTCNRLLFLYERYDQYHQLIRTLN